MSSINCPPPTYQAATQDLPPYTPLETPPSEQYTQEENNGNNLYTVPIYPQQQFQEQQPAYSQPYTPSVISHAETERANRQRIKQRNCIMLALSFVFWIVLIIKFVLFGMIRSSQKFNY